MASACQRDSDATFDDDGLTSPDTAGSGSEAGSATGGAEESGGSSAGATKGGSANTAGKTGTGGTADGGKGGSGGAEPSGGAGVAGTTQGGGGTGTGGKNAGGGGSGGTLNPDPEPVTIDITDVADAYLSSCYPNANFGDEPTVNVDHNQCVYQGLMKPSLADIPDGAVVSKATFTLTCTNAGDTINVSYALGNWSELNVDWNSKPDNGTSLGTLNCQDVGPMTFDLTVAVKAWLSGVRDDDGIYLRTEGTDGTDIASSDAADESERPTLSVTYLLPLK